MPSPAVGRLVGTVSAVCIIELVPSAEFSAGFYSERRKGPPSCTGGLSFPAVHHLSLASRSYLDSVVSAKAVTAVDPPSLLVSYCPRG